MASACSYEASPKERHPVHDYERHRHPSSYTDTEVCRMTEHLSSIVVAIPVNDEAERIADCLRALSLQSGISQYQIVLLLNNCADGSAAVVRDLAPNLPIPVHLFEITLPSEYANAGYARRLAMQAAEDFVAPQGVLLTTDADACVYPNWIATNLLALREGADAVAGCIDIDPAEAALIPPRLHEDDARDHRDEDAELAAAVQVQVEERMRVVELGEGARQFPALARAHLTQFGLIDHV